jgi:hypothetical protein
LLVLFGFAVAVAVGLVVAWHAGMDEELRPAAELVGGNAKLFGLVALLGLVSLLPGSGSGKGRSV